MMLVLIQYTAQLQKQQEQSVQQFFNQNIKQKVFEFIDPNNQTVVLLHINRKTKHAIGVTQNGHIYGYGNNVYGQLGPILSGFVASPQLLPYFKNNNINVKKAVIGRAHTLVLDYTGNIYLLGIKDYSNKAFNPLQVMKFDLQETDQIVNIQVIKNINIAVTKLGKIYVWGNCNKRLCDQSQFIEEPILLSNIRDIQAIIELNGKILFIFTDNTTFYGQLSVGEYTNPKRTVSIKLTNIHLEDTYVNTMLRNAHQLQDTSNFASTNQKVKRLTSGLSSGQIAGIIIGVLLVIGGICIALWLLHRYRIIDMKAVLKAICCDLCQARVRRRAYTQVNKSVSRAGDHDPLAYGEDDW